MNGFGQAPMKKEGHTLDLESGTSHPTTEAERQKAQQDTSTYMELRVDPEKESREAIHERVDEWLNDYERGLP